MKRCIEQDYKEKEENLWEDVLVEDMRMVIVNKLNPLSRMLLSLSSKRNHERYQTFKKKKTIYKGHMARLLAKYGTCELLAVGFVNMESNWSYINLAVKKDNLDAMQWFWDRGHKGDGDTWRVAVSYCNNTATLDWLRSRRTLSFETIFTDAAVRGNLEIMKWLHNEGVKFSAATGCRAVKLGNIENLKWLKEIGCPFQACAFVHAMESRKMNALRWLKDNNIAPWSNDNFPWALRHGDIPLLDWLKKEGHEWDYKEFTEYLAYCARNELNSELNPWPPENLAWLRLNSKS